MAHYFLDLFFKIDLNTKPPSPQVTPFVVARKPVPALTSIDREVEDLRKINANTLKALDEAQKAKNAQIETNGKLLVELDELRITNETNMKELDKAQKEREHYKHKLTTSLLTTKLVANDVPAKRGNRTASLAGLCFISLFSFACLFVRLLEAEALFHT